MDMHAAVSYTHLDVYKRQVHMWYEIKGNFNHNLNIVLIWEKLKVFGHQADNFCKIVKIYSGYQIKQNC